MSTVALLIAAILTIAIGAAHSLLGERWLIGPLLSPQRRQGILEKSHFARQILRFAWHLTTMAWWGFAAILAVLALSPPDLQSRIILPIIAATFVVTGGTILVVSRGRHLAWPVFLAIVALSHVPLL